MVRFAECDLMKFYKAWFLKDGEEVSFENEDYKVILSFIRKEIPIADLQEKGFECCGGYDDLFADGYQYKGKYELYFDDYFVDEEENTYNDGVVPMGFNMTEPGMVFYGDIVIGQKFTQEMLIDAVDGSINGKIGVLNTRHGKSYRILSDIFTCYFSVDENDILQGIQLEAIVCS